jgi:hypothetical protein
MKQPVPIGSLICAAVLILASVYLGGYIVARSTGVLKVHMIGNAEGQSYWIATTNSRGSFGMQFDLATGKRVEPRLTTAEWIYDSLCKAEGEIRTRLLSEEQDLSHTSLPSR